MVGVSPVYTPGWVGWVVLLPVYAWYTLPGTPTSLTVPLLSVHQLPLTLRGVVRTAWAHLWENSLGVDRSPS